MELQFNPASKTRTEMAVETAGKLLHLVLMFFHRSYKMLDDCQVEALALGLEFVFRPTAGVLGDRLLDSVYRFVNDIDTIVTFWTRVWMLL
jgi:hypothetical protein